jgi:hypothetical protein
MFLNSEIHWAYIQFSNSQKKKPLHYEEKSVKDF